MRLFPISIGIGRLTVASSTNSSDHYKACPMKINDYPIPPGVVLVTQNQVMSRDEKHFVRANGFCPERWLTGRNRVDEQWGKPNPYVSLPFGHGPRACIGRRLAEQELLLILVKVRFRDVSYDPIQFAAITLNCACFQMIRRFQISWTSNEKMDCVTRLINAPSVPLALDFKEREL
jgi:ecdysteroid 25-hydroxylase CYP302A1